MTLWHRLASVVRWIVHRSQAEQELADEVKDFVDLSTAEKVRDGIPAAQARRLALLELGGVEPAKERVRTYRHGALLDEVGRDVRYGLRIFARTPGITATIVLTLALGIGANTAIFSVIDALTLRSLPVPNPQELIQLKMQSPGGTTPFESFSYAIVRALANRREIFAGVAGFSSGSLAVGSSGSLVKTSSAWVTGPFYETLGLSPVIGRLLTRDDDQVGAPLVAVISDGYWERQYERSPGVVGQTVVTNGVPVTIVGVTARGFVGVDVGSIADITLPVAALPQVSPEAAPLLGPGNFWLRILARPSAGVSIREAQSRLSAVWPRISPTVIAPNWPLTRKKTITDAAFQFSPGGTGYTYLRAIYHKPLSVLMAVVAVVLLIACANVACLLLARASARQREIAVRLAIGAGRGRIVRQLLVECTLLSTMGAIVGIGLAWFSGRFLVNLISTGPAPVVFDLAPNWHILSFTAAVAIGTAVFFGMAPALQTTAAGPSAVLKEDTRTGTRPSRLLPSLVSAQVALSLVVLVAAGLLARTLQNLQDLDPGFTRDGVLVVEFERRGTALPQDLVDEVRRVPGVVLASVSTHTPLNGSIWSEPAVPAGQPIPEKDTAFFVGAGPGFFRTLRIQLLSGREFTDADSMDRPAVAIVNEVFAHKHFPHDNPVGRHLSASVRGRRTDLEIVGLVKNTNAAGLRKAPPPTVYVSYAQLTGDAPTTLEVRVSGPIGQAASAIQQALQPKLSSVPIQVRPLSVQVAATIVQERMMATLAGGFGLLALVLVCVGLYGLLAYGVTRRTREIGIRMALGARRRLVVGLALSGAVRPVAIGTAIGLPAAWAASRWLESMLFGVKPTDPVAIVAAIALLLTAALLAAFVPARRASRVDPLTALRHE